MTVNFLQIGDQATLSLIDIIPCVQLLRQSPNNQIKGKGNDMTKRLKSWVHKKIEGFPLAFYSPIRLEIKGLHSIKTR